MGKTQGLGAFWIYTISSKAKIVNALKHSTI